MLCYTAQHICALAYIHNISVDLYAVYSRKFVLILKTFPLEPIIGIFCICPHQNSNSAFLGFSIGFGLFFPLATGRGIVISLIFGFWIIPLLSSNVIFIPELF